MKINLVFVIILKLIFISSLKLKKGTNKIKQFEDMVEKLKKSVVMIDISSDLSFIDEHSMNSKATGFVVDAKLGIIATNRHVTRKAPTRHNIRFYDGSVQKGTVIYYDIYHDFGFIQLDFMRKENREEHEVYKYLKAVELGSSYDIKVGDDLLLIGNNEGVNYSVKKGVVTTINISDFNHYGSIIETSFDRTGGSSGSPVWNIDGKVVAIHAMGDKINSYEVPIDYLKNILDKIIDNIEDGDKDPLKIDRGYIGVSLTIAHLFKFEGLKNSNKTSATDKELWENLKRWQRENKKITDSLQIISIAKESPAEGKLFSGDVIMKINDNVVANNILYFENVIDGSIGNELTFTVYRFGKIINVPGVKVLSTKNEKFDEFIKFSNTVIHPVNLSVKLKYPLLKLGEGLFISQVGLSSPFNEIDKSGSIILYSINGIELNTLEDLKNVLKIFGDSHSVNIQAMDLRASFPNRQTYHIDFNDSNDAYLYKFNYYKGGWDKEAIIIKP